MNRPVRIKERVMNRAIIINATSNGARVKGEKKGHLNLIDKQPIMIDAYPLPGVNQAVGRSVWKERSCDWMQCV